MKVGIVANEFFDLSLGRMGGFGWAARQAATTLRAAEGGRFEPVFLAGEIRARADEPDPVAHESRLVLRRADEAEHARRVRDEGIDLLLSIDYRPHYEALFRLLPHTPLVVWVRDPRTPEDIARIRTLRIPGAGDETPAGIMTPDCTSLGRVVAESAAHGRPVLFATPALPLLAKIPGAYGLPSAEGSFLPNIIDLSPLEPIVKSPRPSVVFLGRLDPIKRPWLFAELARHFPCVDFVFLGKPHFEGRGSWQTSSLPDNVRLAGHLDGAEKIRALSTAWALVNTSIHESLAVSFLEALACETPPLACVDGAGTVTDHGVFVGRHDGDGLGGMPMLVDGLSRLLDDGELRTRLGREGRRWVTETHTASRFMTEFTRLCATAGLPLENGPIG
jgi:glycosyltransferase involved in cell wall biosynthesis